MRIVNVHEAKTHLSRLLEQVEHGEVITIARAGKPIATLNAIQPAATPQKPRYGFLKGQIDVPDDFNTMFQEEIERMFYGEDE